MNSVKLHFIKITFLFLAASRAESKEGDLVSDMALCLLYIAKNSFGPISRCFLGWLVAVTTNFFPFPTTDPVIWAPWLLLTSADLFEGTGGGALMDFDLGLKDSRKFHIFPFGFSSTSISSSIGPELRRKVEFSCFESECDEPGCMATTGSGFSFFDLKPKIFPCPKDILRFVDLPSLPAPERLALSEDLYFWFRSFKMFWAFIPETVW